MHRRDFVVSAALAASAMALPALADTRRPLKPMRFLILGGRTAVHRVSGVGR